MQSYVKVLSLITLGSHHLAVHTTYCRWTLTYTSLLRLFSWLSHALSVQRVHSGACSDPMSSGDLPTATYLFQVFPCMPFHPGNWPRTQLQDVYSKFPSSPALRSLHWFLPASHLNHWCLSLITSCSVTCSLWSSCMAWLDAPSLKIHGGHESRLLSVPEPRW